MGKLHSLSIDQEEENFLNGVKEDILRVAKVVGGAVQYIPVLRGGKETAPLRQMQ